MRGCELCIEDLHNLLLISEKIGKVFGVNGEDITKEYFDSFNRIRRTIKQLEFYGEGKNAKTVNLLDEMAIYNGASNTQSGGGERK